MPTESQVSSAELGASNAKMDHDMSYQVICVIGGSGFPFGAAEATRIINVGKALLSAGIKFTVICCGPSANSNNSAVVGSYEGVEYTYTTLTAKRPRALILRAMLHAWGFAALSIRLFKLWPQRHRTCVYLFIQGRIIGVAIAGVCALIGIAVVQEVNEWWPDTAGCTRFKKWLYKHPMFSLATGTLVISTSIEKRVRITAARLDRRLIVHRLPIIADLAKFNALDQNLPLAGIDQRLSYFVWCGDVAGYLEDVLFMIRSLVRVKQAGFECQLVIVGGMDPGTQDRILHYSETLGVGGIVKLTGYIDDYQLHSLYGSAAGLLLPLWDDDRSRTRFPTKLGGYLASGAPVVTCSVGDLTLFLSNRHDAFIGPPGDLEAFAENMCMVLRDPVTARKIGAAGRQVCKTEINYEVHSKRLADFFTTCIRTLQ